MRRAPYVLGATAAGLAALLSFHNRSTSTSQTSGTTSQGATTTSPSSGSSTTSSPQSSAASTTTTGPTSTSPVTSSPPTTAVGTAEGKLETYGYGRLRVRADVKAGKLTNVKVLTLQTADTYSQQIAVQVIPMLRSQAIAAQSYRIQGITGATYTSEGYALSLQSALDKLHFH